MMTENISTESTPSPDDFAGVLDDWIAGATVAKRSVVVYGNLGVYAEYEELERQYEVAKGKASQGEDSLGDGGLAEIETKMTHLYDEFMASKSTWTIRALSEEDFAALRVGLEWPEAPVEPKAPDLSDPEKASFRQAGYDKAKAVFDTEKTVFDVESKKVTNLLNLQVLAVAVENICLADGRNIPSVTVEQLETLRKKMGERQLLKLIQTSQLATYEEPRVPAPFSRSTTQGDQT